MTTIENLLERKQKLLERLQANPGTHERDEIEGRLAQIDTALDMLEEPGESNDEQYSRKTSSAYSTPIAKTRVGENGSWRGTNSSIPPTVGVKLIAQNPP
jgi:hypothetical protein